MVVDMVSELMCQQTQIATVIPYFERWVKKWPDFKALAKADEAALDTHCRSQLAAYKRPRAYHFLEALPRNASDKVRKAALRQAAVSAVGTGEME